MEKIQNKENYEKEIKYILDSCIYSEDAVLSLTAASAIVLLVRKKVLQVSPILSQLLSSLSFTKLHLGILSAICHLLRIDLKSKLSLNEKYKCEYNLKVPQHPLILLLNQQPESYYNIFNKIKEFYVDPEIKLYANELLYSFYMYVICNPSSETNTHFQDILWNQVANINGQQSVDVMLHLMLWFPLSGRHSFKASCFFMDLTNSDRFNNDAEFKEVVILWLTSIVYELIKSDQDPKAALERLTYVITNDEKSYKNCISSILVILTNSICLCPSTYLYDLLYLCRVLVYSKYSSNLALKSLKASLLHWLAFQCVLTEESIQIGSEIIRYIDDCIVDTNVTKFLYSNKLFNLISCTNEQVQWVVELNILVESLNASNILKWLNKIDKLPCYALLDFINCLTALLLQDDSTQEIAEKVVKLIVKICETCKEMSMQMLTLILYKLSRSHNPDINFALLKAIPKMAVVEENLPIILNVLKLINQSLNMKSFCLTLHYDLWQTSNRCYNYLQPLLATTTVLDQGEREFYITKAYVVKQLCLKCPERYGSELVSYLSEILNNCKHKSGTLATSLAFDGIILLCQNAIISIDSTWKALEPNFEKETRVPIINKICEFMGEISHFECSDELIIIIITKLFTYATTHESEEVVSAAYKALSLFPLEDVTVQLNHIIATKFKMTIKSGKSWICLLLNTKGPHLDAVGNLLIKYASNEIASYRKSTYVVPEGSREPLNFNYLPEISIIRELGNYLKAQIQNWQTLSKCVYLQCLRVLSQKYSKSLPPVDWCFLQELIHISEAHCYCIAIASHQVQFSGTARRLMENYIEAMTEINKKDEEIIIIYEQLQYLCNSIQPVTLRPFIERTLRHALEQTEANSLFKTLLSCLRKIFVDDKVHEASKASLSQVVVNITQLTINDLAFDEILACIIKLPQRSIEQLISPNPKKTLSSSQLRLAVKIRCAIALDTNTLLWMDEFLVQAAFITSEHNFVLNSIASLMQSYRSSNVASAWVLEYLNNIQTTVANENMINYNLQFLCNVFIVMMVVLSGHDVFLESSQNFSIGFENCSNLFPQSVTKLMKLEHWNSNIIQIAEWLLHMSVYPETPLQYKRVFYQALVALRHEHIIQSSSKWMKYIAVTLPQ
ncbi:hypothetical protein FQA39_LY03522 [Lamprigera yunnana]|nr:hypothetical protein FQA39_LY03522 [Lamprigera yunnana]